MKYIGVGLLAIVVGACSSSSSLKTKNDGGDGAAGDGGGDAATGGDDAVTDHGDTSGATDHGDTSGGTCPGPIAADAGVTSLDDLPVAELCAQSPWRLAQWTEPCAGSIVVVLGEGVDCASYWLFDATTRQLQATAQGCVGRTTCTGGIAGFVFPTSCFDGNFATGMTGLCPQDGGAD